MKPVHLIGVPLDLGSGRRGVDMGPSAFRIAGLAERITALGHPVVDKGDLPAPIPETQGYVARILGLMNGAGAPLTPGNALAVRLVR